MTGWRGLDLVALDFETTGPDPRTAQPLSVGWVAIRDGRIVLGEGGYTLVRHEGEVPVASLRVHGLLPGQLRDGVPPDALPDLLAEAAEGRWLVAHGAALERRLLADRGVAVAGVLDTLTLVRRVDERAGRHRADPRLVAAARRYGLPALPAHHAFRDALSAALLLLAIVGRLEAERGHVSADDLRRLAG